MAFREGVAGKERTRMGGERKTSALLALEAREGGAPFPASMMIRQTMNGRFNQRAMGLLCENPKMQVSGRLDMPTLIFDGDDTLWETMPLYTSAKGKLYEFLHLQGCDLDEVAAFFEHEDQSNVPLMGFGLDRFEKSVRNTVTEFCPRHSLHGAEVDELVKSIRELIERGPTPVAYGADQILTDLKSYYYLILLTKGDVAIQKQRIASSGLGHLFAEVVIVGEKQQEVFGEILARRGAEASASWSVGNSLRSDVLPAIRIGMNAIWLQKATWAWEDIPYEPQAKLIRVRTLLEVKDVLIPIRE